MAAALTRPTAREAFVRSALRECARLRADPWDLALVTWIPLLLLALFAWMFSAGVPRELPVAVVDLAQLTGPITVQFATGSERFTNLDADEADRPIPGEVIFVDEAGLVCARRWCWRQSDETGARDTTTGILITVEGHHDSADQDIAGALADLQTLLIAHQPGVALQAGQLSPEQPAFLVEA